ncbi:MAG: hypothetical protein Q7U14_10340, partial [Lacisediminimonas sp.]|nr:hypothetical protein [Lacisediminimonas sp.]
MLAMSNSRRRILIRGLVIGLGLVAVIWTGVYIQLVNDEKRWSSGTLQDVKALADSYAQQLTRSVEQIDYLSSSLVYMQENGDLPALIDDQFKYSASTLPLYIAYIDSSGVVRSSRVPSNVGKAVGVTDYFERHKRSPDRTMVINPRSPGNGVLADLEVVRFSRRVDKPDGSFSGVLAIMVEHRYLQSFKALDLYREGDFSSVWHQSGTLLTNW